MTCPDQFKTAPVGHAIAKSVTRQTTSPPRNHLYKSRFSSSNKVSKSEGKKRNDKKFKRIPSLWSENYSMNNWMGKDMLLRL